MNISKSKKTNKLTKILTVFVVLILSFCAAFFSLNTSSTPITVDCKDVTGDPQPGVNCLYSLKPLCTRTGINWTIPDENSSLLKNSQDSDHRVNCLDLSDLPLCSQLAENSTIGYPGKNCVNECSSIASIEGLIRGSDYAVHNRDCVRFCDAPEAGVNPVSGENCTTRKCHQVSDATQPNPPANCALLKCNLLTRDELAAPKFRDEIKSAYQYCDGSIKCHEFSENQLSAAIVNITCKIHDCRVPCIDNQNDDVKILTDKPASYLLEYEKFINLRQSIGSDGGPYCQQKICKPIVSFPYSCSGTNDPPDSPNTNCLCLNCTCLATDGASCICQNNTDCTYDSSSKKWLSKCSNGYCSRTVDCNDTANSASVFCMTSDSETIGTTNDNSIRSWFYRPKPHEMAVTNAGTLRKFEYNSDFNYEKVCYSIGQMDDIGWGSKEYDAIFGQYLGYFHEVRLDSRSPKKCHAADLGIRGTGYNYLCGVKLDYSHNAPRDDASYQYGYVESTFNNTDGTHVETVCLRFDAAGAVGKSCGKRECQITCAFAKEKDNSGCTQICGRDICVDLKIKDSKPDECMMGEGLFSLREAADSFGVSSTSRGCMKIVDGFIRVRGVKYGDYICNFIDFMGDTAHSGRYHDGDRKIFLSDESGNTITYCESGEYTKKTDGTFYCKNGKNTNDEKVQANRWRTIKKVPYVDNVLPITGSRKGYLDVNGRLFPQQNCIKVAHRVTVPRLYNLANSRNSPKLFVPPLYIKSASIKRGGAISLPSGEEDLGETDFHYPEINVAFGLANQKLSLGFGKTGYEDDRNADSEGSATVTTTFDGGTGNDTYALEVFVRKEYNQEADRPTFCLYKKVKDADGVYLDPERVECVYRKYPEINNKTSKLPGEDLRKFIVSADASSTYSNGKIVFQYLSNSGDGDSCSSGGASCSPALSLSNPDLSSENCDLTVENHKICVRREACSKLNSECIQNEIDLHSARLNGEETSSYLSIQNHCNQILLPSCNAKFGINTPTNASISNTNPNNLPIDPKSYGWFNEICVTSGFETKLKRVYAYKTDNGAVGKCVVADVNKCPNGGKKPDCPCQEYAGVDIIGTYDRDETPREAGLCTDIPLPQLCPAINHNPSPNNGSDTDYVFTSLGNNSYGSSLTESSGVINLSHKIRNIGLNGEFNGYKISTGVENNYGIPGIPVAGHADFPQQIFGFNNVAGTCGGFWKNAVVNGVSVPPTSNCLNSSGIAVWDEVINPCVRYSCPAISTSGIDQNGNYQGNYTSLSDPNDQKGLSHGFATWPALTKTNDYLESTSAISCVTGYKKSGAIATWSTGEPSADRAALYGNITGYSGGVTATRTCDQRGNWSSAITNSCQRITCSAINLDANGSVTNIPTSSEDSTRWELWRNSGGASFPAAKAALSTNLIDNTPVKDAAISKGTCNNSLGFFQIAGSPQPTRVCNSLGNWEEVRNPCVTRCEEITCLNSSSCVANDAGHGYATWDAVINVPISGEVEGTFKSCVNNMVIYPYPPLRNKYGAAYSLANCTMSNTSTTCPSGAIPEDVTKDTRTIKNPQRVCRSVVAIGGTANVWTNPSASCIKGCPGFSQDSRINVGMTKHAISGGSTITVKWQDTDFGSWAYYDSSDINNQNASHYFYGRTNGLYSLARYCNPTTHKWDDPIPTCITNDGIAQIGPREGFAPTASGSSYAKYPTPSSATRIAVSGSVLPTTLDGPKIETGEGTCLPGTTYNNNGTYTSAAKKITCAYKDPNNKKIDETYFNTEDSQICIPMCSSYRNKTYGNGSVDLTSGTSTSESSPNYYRAGTKLNLSCRSNFGSQVVGGNNTNAFNDCGRSAYQIMSDRSNLAPSVTCNDNGNGTVSWSSVTNDCSSCRNCDGSSLGYKFKQYEYCRVNCSSSDNTDQCFVIQDNERNGCGNSGDKVLQMNVLSCNHGSKCITDYALMTTGNRQCGGSKLFYGCVDSAYYYPTAFIQCWRQDEPLPPAGW